MASPALETGIEIGVQSAFRAGETPSAAESALDRNRLGDNYDKPTRPIRFWSRPHLYVQPFGSIDKACTFFQFPSRPVAVIVGSHAKSRATIVGSLAGMRDLRAAPIIEVNGVEGLWMTTPNWEGVQNGHDLHAALAERIYLAGKQLHAEQVGNQA